MDAVLVGEITVCLSSMISFLILLGVLLLMWYVFMTVLCVFGICYFCRYGRRVGKKWPGGYGIRGCSLGRSSLFCNFSHGFRHYRAVFYLMLVYLRRKSNERDALLKIE